MPLALSHPTKSLKTKTTNEEPRAPQAGHGCCPCPKQAELTILFLSTLRAVCGLGSQRSPWVGRNPSMIPEKTPQSLSSEFISTLETPARLCRALPGTDQAFWICILKSKLKYWQGEWFLESMFIMIKTFYSKNIMIKTNIEAKCFRKYLFSCIHSHQYSEHPCNSLCGTVD